MRIVIAAVTAFAFAGAAAAATISVPKDQPTVQAGVTAAATGDTVAIAKGVYKENVVVSTPGIRIVGKGAVIDGNIGGVDGDCLTVNAADVVVQGVVFRNGFTQIALNATGLRVLKCTFQDASGDSINGFGSNVVVTSSKFYGMSADAVDLTGDTNSISKCAVSRSGSRGFFLQGNGNRVESCSFVGMDDSNGAYVVGDNAFISKNKASFVDSDCFRVDGNGAVVELNKADRSDSRLAQVNGDNAVVQKNSGTYCQGGILVNGDNAQVLSNKFANVGSSDGLSVNGDAFTITGNSIATTWDDADGISASSNTGPGVGTGGGLIEGNRVSDCAGYGFNLDTIYNVTVRTNSATRCGQDDKGGFIVVGDDNVLQALKTTDGDGPGFLVDGSGNSVTGCVAKKVLTDGFRVDGGNNNTFTSCVASSCGGEGFDNRGTSTQVTNGSFLKNRIDVANDVIGGATLLLTTVKFITGGATIQREVD